MKYRTMVVEKLAEYGICPGALVGISTHRWSSDSGYVSEDDLALVKRIKWQMINFDCTVIVEPARLDLRERVIVAKKLSSWGNERLTLPYDPSITPHQKVYENFTTDWNIKWADGHRLYSGLPSDIVRECVPKDFLSVESSEQFVEKWLSKDPFSKNKRRKRSRSQVRLERFASLMGKSKTLEQEERIFYE